MAITSWDYTWPEFIHKLDSEGGIEAMLMWGGPESFPPEIRAEADHMYDILGIIQRAISAHTDEYQEWLSNEIYA